MAESKGTVWGKNIMMPAAQVRAMHPELLQRSVLMAVEQIEAKAQEFGIEEPAVTVMFLAEFLHAPDDDDEEC